MANWATGQLGNCGDHLQSGAQSPITAGALLLNIVLNTLIAYVTTPPMLPRLPANKQQTMENEYQGSQKSCKQQ